MAAECGRRICTLLRSEACDRRLGKRLERINERRVRRARRLGREGSLPAWGQLVGTGKWRRSREVWLMMCRSCWHRAPARLAAGREGLDHDHAAAAARARARQHTWRVRGDIRLLLRVGGRRSDVEECAGCRDVLGAVGVGKEPVVADAVEALGQHVHQETSDELVRVKPHRLPAIRAVEAIILPAERNRAVVWLQRGGGSR